VRAHLSEPDEHSEDHAKSGHAADDDEGIAPQEVSLLVSDVTQDLQALEVHHVIFELTEPALRFRRDVGLHFNAPTLLFDVPTLEPVRPDVNIRQ
jgi:hypothetical protein